MTSVFIPNKTICLSMIVRDNESSIVETLSSILTCIKINYWVICDMGSTDNTKNVIKKFFQKYRIKGDMYDTPWINFGANKSIAIKKARSTADYVLVFDPSDTIVGSIEIPDLLDDIYTMRFETNYAYDKPVLFNNKLNWSFKGFVFEYPKCNDTNIVLKKTPINGDYHITTYSSPEKMETLYAVMKKSFEYETDEHAIERYYFYTAKITHALGINDECIESAKQVLNTSLTNDQKYYVCLLAGECCFNIGSEIDGVKWYGKASNYNHHRIESIIKMMDWYNSTEQYILTNSLYRKYREYNHFYYKKVEYANKDDYSFRLEYYNSVAAYYVNDFKTGLKCCYDIIKNKRRVGNDGIVEATIKNCNFYA